MAEYYRVYERSLDVFLKIPNLSPFLRNLSVVLLPNDFSESLRFHVRSTFARLIQELLRVFVGELHRSWRSLSGIAILIILITQLFFAVIFDDLVSFHDLQVKCQGAKVITSLDRKNNTFPITYY